MKAVVEPPDGLRGKSRITRLPDCELLLCEVVKSRRNDWESAGIKLRGLVAGRANLPGCCVRASRRCGTQRRNRPSYRNDRKRIDEWFRGRAGCLVAGETQLVASGALIRVLAARRSYLAQPLSPGAQTTLGYQHTACREQPHLQEVAPAG